MPRKQGSDLRKLGRSATTAGRTRKAVPAHGGKVRDRSHDKSKSDRPPERHRDES